MRAHVRLTCMRVGVCLCVCSCGCAYVHVCMSVCMYARPCAIHIGYVYLYIYIHVYTCIHAYSCIYVHLFPHSYTFACKYREVMNVCLRGINSVYTHIYMCMYICIRYDILPKALTPWFNQATAEEQVQHLTPHWISDCASRTPLMRGCSELHGFEKEFTPLWRLHEASQGSSTAMDRHFKQTPPRFAQKPC